MSFSPDGRPLNKCAGCGCYVDLGVERCPNCRREIVNRHTFWYKYQEHILRGLAGVGVGFVLWFSLSLALSKEITDNIFVGTLLTLLPLFGGAGGFLLGYQAQYKRLW